MASSCRCSKVVPSSLVLDQSHLWLITVKKKLVVCWCCRGNVRSLADDCCLCSEAITKTGLCESSSANCSKLGDQLRFDNFALDSQTCEGLSKPLPLLVRTNEKNARRTTIHTEKKARTLLVKQRLGNCVRLRLAVRLPLVRETHTDTYHIHTTPHHTHHEPPSLPPHTHHTPPPPTHHHHHHYNTLSLPPLPTQTYTHYTTSTSTHTQRNPPSHTPPHNPSTPTPTPQHIHLLSTHSSHIHNTPTHTHTPDTRRTHKHLTQTPHTHTPYQPNYRHTNQTPDTHIKHHPTQTSTTHPIPPTSTHTYTTSTPLLPSTHSPRARTRARARPPHTHGRTHPHRNTLTHRRQCTDDSHLEHYAMRT